MSIDKHDESLRASAHSRLGELDSDANEALFLKVRIELAKQRFEHPVSVETIDETLAMLINRSIQI